MRTLAMVLAAAMVLGAALLCGCGGGSSVIVVPEEFLGTWGAMAFQSNGHPLGGGILEVLPDGDIMLQEISLTSAGVTVLPARAGTLIGHVTSAHGHFSASVTAAGHTVILGGQLRTDDTGSGSWREGPANGALQLWRANHAGAFALDVVVSGPATGTGTITVDTAGVVTGSITVNGDRADVSGVVTNDGHIVAGWNGPDGLFVLIEGDVTLTGATGTWDASEGIEGTWTATFD